jgi:hypothetical protein
VLYIDTELKFSQQRLRQVMQQRMWQTRPMEQAAIDTSSEAPADNTAVPTDIVDRVDNIVKRVHVIQPQTGMAWPIRVIKDGCDSTQCC